MSIAWNASRLLEWFFLTLVPMCRATLSSDDVSCIATITCAIGECAAAYIAEIRFRAASELGLSELLCEPTSITGLLSPLNAKLRAAAVYARVSVPWSITTPATSSLETSL